MQAVVEITPRNRPKRKALNLWMKEAIIDKLTLHAEALGHTRTSLTEQLLEEYFAQVDKESRQ